MQARLKGLSAGYYRVVVGRKLSSGTGFTSFVAGPTSDGVAVGTPGAPLTLAVQHLYQLPFLCVVSEILPPAFAGLASALTPTLPAARLQVTSRSAALSTLERTSSE